MLRRMALGFSLILGFPLAALGSSATVSPAERQQQLQRLEDDLNNPNPLTRITTLEAVLAGNDDIAREIAIEVALGSNDSMMQSYAAKLLLSSARIVNIQVKLPAAIQSEYDQDQAEENSPGGNVNQLNRFKAKYAYAISMISRDGGTVTVTLKNFDTSSGTFVADCERGLNQDPEDFPGQLTNTTLQFEGLCYGGMYGAHLCSATMQLQPQGVFSGTLACQGLETPLLASFTLR